MILCLESWYSIIYVLHEFLFEYFENRYAFLLEKIFFTASYGLIFATKSYRLLNLFIFIWEQIEKVESVTVKMDFI